MGIASCLFDGNVTRFVDALSATSEGLMALAGHGLRSDRATLEGETLGYDA